MSTPDLAFITPAEGDRPAQITLVKDGEIISHDMDLATMTKIQAQLAIEIRNAFAER